MYRTAKENPAMYAMLVVKSREGEKGRKKLKNEWLCPSGPGGGGMGTPYNTESKENPILSIRRKPL